MVSERLNTFLYWLDYPLGHHWADVFGIIGFPLAVWGILITLREATKARESADKAKTASQEAQEAVNRLRETIIEMDVIADLSAVVAEMEEIKRSHRSDILNPALLDRYSGLRQKLLHVHSIDRRLNDEQRSVIQGAVTQFRVMERNLERYIDTGSTKPQQSRTNDIVTTERDKIEEILFAVRQKTGE